MDKKSPKLPKPHAIGDRFEVPEDIKKFIEETDNAINAHRSAMDHHALQAKRQLSVLWETLSDKIPGIDSSRFIYTYCSQDNSVNVVGIAPFHKDRGEIDEY